MVAAAGLEPAHPYERQILSLVCLPIPPSGLNLLLYIYSRIIAKKTA